MIGARYLSPSWGPSKFVIFCVGSAPLKISLEPGLDTNDPIKPV